jgi:hypothetical protein
MVHDKADVTQRTRSLCSSLQDKVFHFTHHPVVEYKKNCKQDYFQEHTSNMRENYLLKARHDWCQLCGDSIEEGKWVQCEVSNNMFCVSCIAPSAGGCLHCEKLDRAKRLAMEQRLAEEDMLDEMAADDDVELQGGQGGQ